MVENPDESFIIKFKELSGFFEPKNNIRKNMGDNLEIGKQYRYSEWDDNNNYVDCEYVGEKETNDGMGYEFKYITGSKGYFITLYPEKLKELKNE